MITRGMSLNPLSSLRKNLFAAFFPPALHQNIEDIAFLVHRRESKNVNLTVPHGSHIK